MFSPEFAPDWLAEHVPGHDASMAIRRDDESLSPSQEEALKVLVERVNAARSIV